MQDTGSPHVRAILQCLFVQRRSRARRAADDRASLGWEGRSTPAEGRPESVPEAGGTGAEAVTTPTTPTRRSRRGLAREIDGFDGR